MNGLGLQVKSYLYVMAMAFLTACSGGDGGTLITPDTTPPMVASVYPADSSSGVVVTTPVRATFSEALDATTLDTSSFTLETTSGGVPVSATLSYDTTSFIATLTPDSSLANGTQYTATVTTAVTDAAGNALGSDYSWTFTTAAVTAVWVQVGGRVSPNTAESEDPTMLITGTTPSVGYRQGSYEINLNTWDGASWGSTKVHPESGNINGSIYSTPGFASDGTNIFVAYSLAGGTYFEDAAFYDRIYLDQCTPASAWSPWNGGNELSVPWNATFGGSNAYEPAVAVAPGGTPFVAWTEEDVVPSPDTEFGAWVSSVSLNSAVRSTILSRDDRVDPSYYTTDVRTVGITADASGNVYLAQWESDAPDQDRTNLYVTHYSGDISTNLGGAVSADYDYNNLSLPSMVLDGTDLYIAYTEANAVDYTKHVYVKRYSGGSWTTVGGGPVSAFAPSDHYDSANPDLLLVNGTLYLAWEESDQSDGPFIYVARWDQTGDTWLMDGDRLNVNLARDAYDPSLTYSSGDNTLYVAFEELVSGWPGIFVKRKVLGP